MNVSRRDLALAATLAAAMGGTSLAASALVPRRLIADERAREPLARIVPAAFGDWREAPDVRLVPPAPDVADALARAYDDLLARAYRAGDGRLVMLSLAYGRQQRGEGILHRPEVCYAAQGFDVQPWGGDAALAVGARRVEVTRLVARGRRPEPITYWLVVGDRVVRFGGEWRRATLAYALRGEVADGVLVRLSSLDADPVRAFALHERFVRELAAALGGEARERLLGSA